MMRPMRFIWTLLLFTSMNCFASTEANCQLVNGVYNNSSNILNELKFSTIVDIFVVGVKSLIGSDFYWPIFVTITLEIHVATSEYNSVKNPQILRNL